MNCTDADPYGDKRQARNQQHEAIPARSAGIGQYRGYCCGCSGGFCGRCPSRLRRSSWRWRSVTGWRGNWSGWRGCRARWLLGHRNRGARERQYKGQRDNCNNYQHVSPRGRVVLLVSLHSIPSRSRSFILASILQSHIASNSYITPCLLSLKTYLFNIQLTPSRSFQSRREFRTDVQLALVRWNIGTW